MARLHYDTIPEAFTDCDDPIPMNQTRRAVATFSATSPSSSESDASSGSPLVRLTSPCTICAVDEAKYNYYGARSCTSCRAFFKRSVLGQAYDSFSCSMSQSCEINSKSWKSCRYCRFRKCLSAGMKIECVARNEQRKVARKTKFEVLNKDGVARKTKRRREEAMEADEILEKEELMIVRAERPIENTISREEFVFMENMLEKYEDYFYGKQCFYYSINVDSFRKMLQRTYYGGSYSFQELQELKNFLTSIHCMYWSETDDMQSLGGSDTLNLVRVNLPIMFNITSSVYMHPIEAATHFNRFLRQMGRSGMSERTTGILRSVFHELGLSPEAPPLRFERVNTTDVVQQYLSSPWLARERDENRYRVIVEKMMMWPRDAQVSPKDDIQLLLLVMVIMFNTDLVELANKTAVERIQNKYLKMLHRYLKYKYGEEANRKLAEGLMLVSMATEMIELQTQTLQL